jgi:hypothetical protein
VTRLAKHSTNDLLALRSPDCRFDLIGLDPAL